MRLSRRPRLSQRSGYAGSPKLTAGETVAAGRYRCRRCGHRHEVGERIVNLPLCPRCQADEWDLAR